MTKDSLIGYIMTVGLVSLGAGTKLLSAQAVPGTYTPTPAECQAATESLLDKPSNNAHWQILPSCGRAGGRDLATALQGARSETDPAYLERLYGAMANIRDPDVFSAALSLMQDQG